jgi:hypothetical protein
MDRVDTASQVNLLSVHIVHKVHAVHRARARLPRAISKSAFNLDCRIWAKAFDDGFGGLARGDVH